MKKVIIFSLLICSVAFAVTQQNAIEFKKTVTVNGATDLDSTLNVDGAATFNSTLGVTGHSTLSTGQVGTGSISASSLFDTFSTAKGSRPAPSMNQTQRDAIATPATGLMIFNTTVGKYNYYDGSSWQDVGSGAGSGGKNYIESNDFEDGSIGDWTESDDTKLNISVTSTTDHRLAGSFTALVTKSAVDASGAYVQVISETVDPIDRGNPLTFKFAVNATHDTDYVSGDFTVQAVDQNDVALVVTGFADGVLPISYEPLMRVLTNSDTTEVKLRLAVPTDNATAADWSVSVDSFSFGPDGFFQATINNYLGELTTTGSWSTNTTYVGKYWQDGDWLIGDVLVTLGGAPDATSLTITLPNSLQIDTEKLSAGTSLEQHLGSGIFRDSGAARYPINLIYGSSTTLTLQYFVEIDETADITRHSTVTNLLPETMSSGDTVHIRYRVPIEGWDSGALLTTTQLNHKSAIVSATMPSGVNIANNTTTDLVFDTENEDRFNTHNTSTGVFTAHEPGWYVFLLKAQLSGLTVGTGVYNAVLATSGGTTINTFGRGGFHGAAQDVGGMIFQYLDKGDTAKVRLIQTNGATRALAGTDSLTSLSIFSWNDLLSVGGYTPRERLETIITATTSTTVADTAVDVTGGSIELSPGTWELCFAVMAGIQNVGASLNTTFGDIRMLDSSDILVGYLQAGFGGIQEGDNDDYTTQSRCSEVIVTSTATFNLAIRNSDDAASAITTIYGNAIGSTLTGDDNQSMIWAERKR